MRRKSDDYIGYIGIAILVAFLCALRMAGCITETQIRNFEVSFGDDDDD